jgi:hypothetical protein
MEALNEEQRAALRDALKGISALLAGAPGIDLDALD